MKLLSKIKAFFKYNGKAAEIEASSAEIRNGYVYLHSTKNPKEVCRIRSQSVEILINPNEDISEDDLTFMTVTTQDNSQKPKQAGIETNCSQQEVSTSPNKSIREKEVRSSSIPTYAKKPISYFMPKMRKITFTLYPDEYDMLMTNIKDNGYRKTEFLLACVASAKKSSMASTYQKYTNSHKERRIADRQAALLAQEKDYRENQKIS